MEKRLVPIGISNRHIHVSESDLKALFGEDALLTKFKDLSQPGQYACDETISIVGPKGAIHKVRILGPVRKETQLEILQSDTRALGIEGMVRESGKLDGTPWIILQWPKGEVALAKGVIVAARHIHMHPNDAQKLHVADGQKVMIEAGADGKKTIFGDVCIRVNEAYALEMHLDTDEGNAACIKTGDVGVILD